MKLYLVPTPISEHGESDISTRVTALIQDLRYWVVEDIRTARRVLRKLGYRADFDTEVHFFEWNKHESIQDFQEIKQWMHAGYVIGLMSEAGLPCIADPGHSVVALAYQNRYQVVPLAGPSSIILGLISSGLNGQNFAFNGYLPIEKSERAKKLKQLEARLMSEQQTQIFMETPYRNLSLFEELLKVLSPNIYLSIASDIGGDNAYILTQKLSAWKQSSSPPIHKKPTIFSIGLG